MNDPVDVLIIGAGASGAAVAWSLADTKMHILCLEQGGWMNPATYPSTGRDWEARAFGDYSPSPNIRARPEDYPINDDNSPIKVVNFNGVGGGTVMYTAHFPRLHPSDFRVKSLDGVAEDWPIDYDTLGPVLRGERPDDGGLRSRRRSRRSAAKPADAATAARPLRDNARKGDEPARLALVAVRHHGRHRGLRGTRALHQSRPLHAGLRTRGEGEHRHHLLAGRAASRRRIAHPLPGTRGHDRRARHGRGGGVLRRGRKRAISGRTRCRACLQWCGHAAAIAEFGLRAVPERARQLQRAGRQELDVPPLRPGLRVCGRRDGQQPRAADLPVEQGVLRNRPLARLSCAATRSSSAAASGRS